MNKGRSINSIVKELLYAYKTVHRMATVIPEAICQQRGKWCSTMRIAALTNTRSGVATGKKLAQIAFAGWSPF